MSHIEIVKFCQNHWQLLYKRLLLLSQREMIIFLNIYLGQLPRIESYSGAALKGLTDAKNRNKNSALHENVLQGFFFNMFMFFNMY
jgi:hypothetical protein